jgi:hypothetical protein
MLPYYCRTSVRQQHTWHCPLEFEHSTRFIHHAAYLSTASTTCGRFSPRTASRKDISCLEGTPMHDAANELRRIPLLRGWVNKGKKAGRDLSRIWPYPPRTHAPCPAPFFLHLPKERGTPQPRRVARRIHASFCERASPTTEKPARGARRSSAPPR